MLSGSLDKRRRDKFIHGKTTEITSRWWGLVLVEVGACYAYGTRWMTHARCMQIKMAESTQRAGCMGIAEAWPLAGTAACLPPDDAGPACTFGAFDGGFAGRLQRVLVCGYLKCEFRS